MYKNKHLFLLTPIILIALLALFACSYDTPLSINNSDLSGNISSEDREQKTDGIQTDIVVDGETIYDFYTIVNDIGIDTDNIEVSKIEDWAQGPRYTFSSMGRNFTVFCDMNGKIKSINLGVDLKLYEEGYEIWKIENFIVDDSVKDELILYTKEYVKECLNYPSTTDFSLFDWTFGREFNLYQVQSQVKAQNTFGVESEIPFSATYWIEDETIELIYLQVNLNEVINKLDDYQIPERKKLVESDVDVETNVDDTTDTSFENNDTIHIVDGEIGEYGKKVKLDNYEYIWYMVPAGEYEVTGESKFCMIYVDKNETSINSDGYVEVKNVATYNLGYGETVTIIIGEDEHLYNVYGAEYTLKKID